MIRIGIVAGEASGDLLGANLISAVKEQYPDIEVTGIGGEKLINAGCRSLYPMERLSVMGIIEVGSRFFELLMIRQRLKKYFLENPPDVFIGVDAPDFNFTLERALKNAGIKTIHYVSPSIWAWREYRIKKIARSVDLMLSLFPFEIPYYEKYDIPVAFVGHPLAEKIKIKPNKSSARNRLKLPQDKQIIALMTGSRKSELEQLIVPFLETANLCNRQNSIHFIAGLTNEDAKTTFLNKLAKVAPGLLVSIYIGQSLDVMEAADVVLLASGTVALEAMLLKRPMVVAYKLNRVTYEIAKRMVRIPFVSLPNILAGRQIIPECLQEKCTPELLQKELMTWLENKQSVLALEEEFTKLHQKLLSPENKTTGAVVLDLINANPK